MAKAEFIQKINEINRQKQSKSLLKKPSEGPSLIFDNASKKLDVISQLKITEGLIENPTQININSTMFKQQQPSPKTQKYH